MSGIRIDKKILTRSPAPPYEICYDQNKCLVEFLKIRRETPLENPKDYPRGHPLHRSFTGPCRKPFRQESFLNNHIHKVHERKNGWVRTPLRNVITVDLPVSSSVGDSLESVAANSLDSSTELDLDAQIDYSSPPSSSVGDSLELSGIAATELDSSSPSSSVGDSLDSSGMPEMEATELDRGAVFHVLPGFEVIIPPNTVYRCPNDWCSKEFGRKEHQERHLQTCRLFFCHCKRSFVTQKKLSLHQKYMKKAGKTCNDDAN